MHTNPFKRTPATKSSLGKSLVVPAWAVSLESTQISGGVAVLQLQQKAGSPKEKQVTACLLRRLVFSPHRAALSGRSLSSVLRGTLQNAVLGRLLRLPLHGRAFGSVRSSFLHSGSSWTSRSEFLSVASLPVLPTLAGSASMVVVPFFPRRSFFTLSSPVLGK